MRYFGVELPNANCDKCKYYHGCDNPFVRGEGKKYDPIVVFVGEAPGETEDRKQRPFVGKSGRLLRKAVADAEATKDVYYTNLCMCRPSNNKLSLSKAKLCAPRLVKELIEVCGDNTVIVPLGAKPLEAFMGKGLTISQCRMRTMKHESGRVLIPQYHPSYILRNAHLVNQYVAEIGKIISIARGEENIAHMPTEPEDIGSYRLVNEEEFLDYCDSNGNILSVDVESNTLTPFITGDDTRLLTVAVSARDGEAVCLPVDHPEVPKELGRKRRLVVRDALRGKWCIGHNIKYDSHILFVTCGFSIRQYYDTMLAHHVIYPVRGTHGLKEVAMSELGIGDYERPIRELEVKDYSKVPLRLLWKYNCIDADITFRLASKLDARFEKNKDAGKIFKSLTMPMSKLYTQAERVGMGFDMERAARSNAEYQGKETELRAKMNADPKVSRYNMLRGSYMNFNSPQQISDVLYGDSYYNLPVISKTDSGKPGTSQPVLKKLIKKFDCPFAEDILALRKLTKVTSTYLKPPLEGKWVGSDGRVHPNFKLFGTETGRLSCDAPNLQNIPRGEIRGMFCAPEDMVLVESDFSQMELRVLAVESEDATLTKAFTNGVDVHTQTASKLFGKSIANVLPEERQQAKTINFGIIYGMSEHGFADRMNVSKERASTFIRKYFEEFPQVHDWLLKTKYFVEENGYVKSMTGRVRYLPDAQIDDQLRKGKAFKEATNAPIQAAASDLVQYSILVVNKLLRRKPKWKARIVLSVHDSVVVECLQEYSSQLAELLDRVMPESAKSALEVDTPIEFPVDISVIKRLGEK